MQGCRCPQEEGISRYGSRIIVNNESQPRTNGFPTGVENDYIHQGVIGLPNGIGVFGTMAVDEFVAIAKSHHALDQGDEFRRELSISRIGPFGFYQADQSGTTVSGKPTLNGLQWDTRSMGRFR